MSSALIRALDITISLIGLIVLSPLILAAMVAVWYQDGFSPFYIARRAGLDEQPFEMVKLRSMIRNADRNGVASTSNTDQRITRVGHLIRRYKLDEITQLWNVLKGDMSLVGPRPNVLQAVAGYSSEEKRLLSVRPGITDLASIVFSDEGEILRGSPDPDLLYEQIIRPWKSRLGLFYIEKRSFVLNLRLVFLTIISIVNKPAALRGIHRILMRNGADSILINVARRENPLPAYPPPGMTHVVQSLDAS
jgi:lipopolysaccharide/colanic/teichoic acid biosynthesis glycosyltransferase